MHEWMEKCVSSNKELKKNYHVTIRLESDIKLTYNMI